MLKWMKGKGSKFQRKFERLNRRNLAVSARAGLWCTCLPAGHIRLDSKVKQPGAPDVFATLIL